jgi:CRISPR/Cas system CSM-associated protein Csm2 small subunit
MRESRPASAGVPHNYLTGGYFAGQNRALLKEELYLGWAEQWAELLVYRRLSAGQLRGFYNHVRRAAAALQAGADAQQTRSQVLRLSGFAAARVGKPGFPQEFREFLDRNIEQVKDADSLKAFAEHFQAVVGYTAGRLRN